MARARFFLPWLIPVALAAAAARSGWLAWALMAGIQLALALTERVPAWRHSPPPSAGHALHRLALHGQAALQLLLLGWALWCQQVQGMGAAQTIALALAVGGTTGSQGITFAHELGHSRSRLDRAIGWLLMISVCYAHFMVEHYRGHHPRAATDDDPASARRGESLWRFLPRTLAGSWASGWALERRRLAQFYRGWGASPLAWATAAQIVGLLGLTLALGALASLFWLVQAAYAVWLLETVNYIEHYGLRRRSVDGRREPFGAMHAWNADHWLTNSLLINLQRHSDHHMHAWKPYAALEPLPGPELPTGYAGCLFLATVPRLWFGAMHRRLDALAPASAVN